MRRGTGLGQTAIQLDVGSTEWYASPQYLNAREWNDPEEADAMASQRGE
jgi:hypothetical protein